MWRPTGFGYSNESVPVFNNSSSYQQFPPVASNASPFLSEQWNAQTLAGNFGVASPNTPYPPSHPFPQSQGHQAVSSGQPPTTHQHVPVRNVVVNSRKLSDMEVTDLQNTLRFPIVDGEVRFSLDYLVLHATKSLLSHVALSGLHSLAAKSLLPLPRAIFTSLSNILH